MAQNDFVPTSWNGEAITTDKLNQMCNNTQYLYDRSPRIRYTTSGLTRDTGLKLIAGKFPFTGDGNVDYQNIPVYFGSFFSAGCSPVVTATIEAPALPLRRTLVIQGLTGTGVDQNGFIAGIWLPPGLKTPAGGWIHWQAVGY